MRPLVLAVLCASLASPLKAEGFAAAIVGPATVPEPASAPDEGPGADVLVPLAVLAVLMTVAASRDGDEPDGVTVTSGPYPEEPPPPEAPAGP
jgi:hypothetical protein